MTRHERDFEGWYQEQCDSLYWRRGQCCAGCDFWASDGGMTGECRAAGIMPGEDVMRSMGITWSTRRFEPGYPFTAATHWCGKFKDDFDWSSLDDIYLRRIGATVGRKMHPKPSRPATTPNSPDSDPRPSRRP